MERSYQLQLGSDLIDAALGNAAFIAGIAVDNPSGSYLSVSGINQTVPPYTNGWTIPVLPVQAAISVRFVDSPSGTVSERVGESPHVTIYDIPLPISPGFPSGESSKIPALWAATILQATEGGSLIALAPEAPNKIFPVMVNYAFLTESAWAPLSAGTGPRGAVYVEANGEAGSGVVFPNVTLTPQYPTFVQDLRDFPFLTGAETISFVGTCQEGIGRQAISVVMAYRRVQLA